MADKYDDLDDLLDEFEEQDAVFGSAPPAPSVPTPTASAEAPSSGEAAPITATPPIPVAARGPTSNTAPIANVPDALPELDQEFANKLNLGVEDLVKEMENDPQAKELLESLMQGLTGQQHSPAEPPASFQDTISKTMDRLNESKAGAGAQDDMLASLLAELQGAAANTDGGQGMDGLLASLMEELASKEVLYEPIKEIHDKYPGWLEEHEPKLSAQELERYRGQQTIISSIVTKFESAEYSDSDSGARAYISAKMEEMQASGAPPPELMGDVANGALGGDLKTPDCGMQ